jgi:hypothetical protein
MNQNNTGMKYLLAALGLFFTCIVLQAQDLNLSEIKKEKPFRWTGTLNIGADFYGNQGDVPIRSDRFGWRINGNPTAYVYGWALPFSFTLGRQIRDVRYPSFRQFGVSPTWKWLKIHAGWRNMNFSPYTLAGHTFLGAGVELNPGLLRFSAMYGRFQRAALTNAGQAYFLPTYKRMGYGVKLGIGTDRNYFDVMAFRAKDDPNSLPPGDTLRILPAENLVLGASGRLTLWNALTFTIDGAASAYTRNLGSEAVHPDSLQNGQYYGVENWYQPRFSTRFNFAGKASLGWSGRSAGAQLSYEHIDPEYATMGAYFFNNDIENYTVNPYLTLKQGKVRLSGSYGIQRNNLLGNRSETSWRNIGSANVSVNPGARFGIDLNYSNYRMSQSSGAFELSDSLKLAQSTTQYSVTPRYTIFGKKYLQNILFNAVYQFLDDQNPLTETYGDVRARVGILNWSLVHTESQRSVNLGLNYNAVTLGPIRTANYGFQAGAGWGYGKKRGQASVSGAYNLARLNGAADGAVFNLTGNNSWALRQRHHLNLGVHFIRSTSAFRGKYAEWRVQLGYGWVLR